MRATIAQIDAGSLEADWAALRAHVASAHSEFVLLPEMGFAPWFCGEPIADANTWDAAVHAHERWLMRLPELGAAVVVGTAPRSIGARKRNVGYVWTAGRGLRWDHQKTYLPNDHGYWEANWYDRAPIDFRATRVGDLGIGLMICTELWFLQHARAYGQAGIHLLLNPRSTPATANDKWLAGGRTAAVVSGAYCLSSNHTGNTDHVALGGCGWICDPDGDVLATTSADAPFVTLNLDLRRADAAKQTYPRYVDDSSL